MAAAASERMHEYCGFSPVQQRVQTFFDLQQPGAITPVAAKTGAASC